MVSFSSPPPRNPAALLALAALLLLGGCAQTFTVRPANPLKEHRPGFVSQQAAWVPGKLSPGGWTALRAEASRSGHTDATAALQHLEMASLSGKFSTSQRRAAIELSLWAGVREQSGFGQQHINKAAGFYLLAAQLSNASADRDGSSEDADFVREANRFAIARLVDLYKNQLTDGHEALGEVDSPAQRYELSAPQGSDENLVPPVHYDLLMPTDRYRLIHAPAPTLVSGPGAPLVARVRGANDAKTRRHFELADDTVVPLTATVRFGATAPNGAREAFLELHDPRWQETAGKCPLAADYTTPLAAAVELGRTGFLNLGLLGFLRGDRYYEKTGLYPVEPHQPGKIPVVLVHGLISEPNDWRFLRNALLADPTIRRNCQFWVFFYPTSLPVTYSAAMLREGLDTARDQLDPARHDPAMSQMLIVGHSMGGLLARLQISDSGNTLYRQWFQRPLQELVLDATDREFLKNTYFFKANPDITEAIFLCVPHRGSPLAASIPGKIARLIVNIPQRVLSLSVHIVTLNPGAFANDVTGSGSSIDSLTPGSHLFRALAVMPMSPRVRLHSIIGDRGRGDTPNSSDGVVPYWSSHLPDASSEKIIPAPHSALANPQAMEEIHRILLEHLRRRAAPAEQRSMQTTISKRR